MFQEWEFALSRTSRAGIVAEDTACAPIYALALAGRVKERARKSAISALTDSFEEFLSSDLKHVSLARRITSAMSSKQAKEVGQRATGLGQAQESDALMRSTRSCCSLR